MIKDEKIKASHAALSDYNFVVMKKMVVYTAITSGYDVLKDPPPHWRATADFVAFLSTEFANTQWVYRPIYKRFRDPCRNAKIHKILAHKYFPQAEYSLWIDGTISIISPLPLNEWVERYLKNHDLAVFRHWHRNCAYEEAKKCMLGQLDDPQIIERQMQKYFDNGYPRANGLAECSVLLRRHTSRIKRFNEKWWDEIRQHSRRDQLSFNYVADRLGVTYFELPGYLPYKGITGGNNHFQKSRHDAPHSKPQ